MAKSKDDGPQLTVAEQIHELGNLRQGAAAHLAGLHGKTLRDADTPRSRDGTYDARKLFQWMMNRVEPLKLDDTQYERLLVVVDALAYQGGYHDNRLPAAVEFIDELAAEHGQAALLLVAQKIIQIARVETASWKKREEPETPKERAAREAREREEERQMEADSRLDIAVVCDECRSLRQGRKWVRREPPKNHVVVYGICPNCY